MTSRPWLRHFGLVPVSFTFPSSGNEKVSHMFLLQVHSSARVQLLWLWLMKRLRYQGPSCKGRSRTGIARNANRHSPHLNVRGSTISGGFLGRCAPASSPSAQQFILATAVPKQNASPSNCALFFWSRWGGGGGGLGHPDPEAEAEAGWNKQLCGFKGDATILRATC